MRKKTAILRRRVVRGDVPGEQGHPTVVAAVEDAIRRIRACGKPAGILTSDTSFAERCIALGTTFTAVAIDVGVLARTTEGIARRFKAR